MSRARTVPRPVRPVSLGPRVLLVFAPVVSLLLAGWWYWAGGSAGHEHRRADGTRWPLPGRPDMARAALEDRLANNPDDLAALRAMVELEIREGGRWPQVGPWLDRLCRANPNDSDALILRAEFLTSAGRPDEALADYCRVADLRPADESTRWHLARLAVGLGRYDLSDPILDRLMAGASGVDAIDAGILLAKTNWDRGEYERAAAVLDRADPTAARPTTRLLRGLIAFRNGDWPHAIDCLRAVSSPDPSECLAAEYHLGMALDRAGSAAEATAAFRRADAIQRAVRAEQALATNPRDDALRVTAAREYLAASLPGLALRALEPIARRAGPPPAELAVLLRECRGRVKP